MTDVYFQMITKFWVSHFDYLQDGGDAGKAQERKDKFVSALRGYLPVTSLKYSDNPFNLTFEKSDGGLVSVTQISDTDEAVFPEKIGEHTLLTVEHFNGCWSALYAVEMKQ